MEVFHSFSKILLFIIQQLLRPDWIPGTVWGIASEYNIDKIQFFPTSSSFFNMWTKDRIYANNNIWLYRGLISAAAAPAKSLQSCPTLCDPIDGSLPGSPVPGILQARTLEWVAISFSNAWKWKVKVKSLSHVWLLATSWTAAHQAPPSMGFSKQEYWSGVIFKYGEVLEITCQILAAFT